MRNPRKISPGWIAVGTFTTALLISVSALPGAAPPGSPPVAAAPSASAGRASAPKAPTPKTPPPASSSAPPSADVAAPLPSTSSSAVPESTEPQGRRTALVAALTLKVLNPKDTREALQAQAKELGGFAVLVTDRELTLKLPPRTLSAFVDSTAERGLVLDKTLERADLTLEISNLESQLKSKRTILAELQGFFDGSDVAATLRIETSMGDIVNELEAVKGQLRVLYDRSDWAVVKIAFQFTDREPQGGVASPFEWLNTVSLDRFLSEF